MVYSLCLTRPLLAGHKPITMTSLNNEAGTKNALQCVHGVRRGQCVLVCLCLSLSQGKQDPLLISILFSQNSNAYDGYLHPGKCITNTHTHCAAHAHPQTRVYPCLVNRLSGSLEPLVVTRALDADTQSWTIFILVAITLAHFEFWRVSSDPLQPIDFCKREKEKDRQRE